MFGWILLDAMLGGDAETLLGEADFGALPEGEEGDERESDAAPPEFG